MGRREELAYKIAFSSYRNINRSTAGEMLSRGVDAESFFTLGASALSAMTGVKAEFFDDERRRMALAEASKEVEFVENNGIKPLYFVDEDYPRRLAACDDAPAMVYTLGGADLECRHVVSVVGTRHSTAYGLDFTSHLVADLAAALDGLLVVSGLAYGIDAAAHKAALAAGVPTVAVFAHGLNTVYPADHRSLAVRMVREGGMLVSEYKSTDHINRGNFLARNRIVAGLADVTVVVESDIRGGAMTTARIASAYNREVMAVPGRVTDTYSRGCNHLIAAQTASIIRDAGDLIDAAGWTVRPTEGTQAEIVFDLTDEQKRILAEISAHPEATVNDMCVLLGMPYSQLSALLFQMEMDDVIISIPGGRYVPGIGAK